MSKTDSPERDNDTARKTGGDPERGRLWPIAVALGCWLLMALSFPALKILMQERPQFVGRWLQVPTTKLLQESPRMVLRRVRDDASVLEEVQAEQSDVAFRMKARRDYRGLRTIIDMAGEFKAQYTIMNPHAESAFVLFRCPHPRPDGGYHDGLNASALTLDAGDTGVRENTANAWFWSGELGPGESQQLTVSYRVTGVRGVEYRIDSGKGIMIKAHRVEVSVEDLPDMVFESADGRAEPEGASVVWERRDFLPPDRFAARIAETRSLYTALSQLLDMGPLVSLLFMVAVMGVLLSRSRPTGLQIVTLSAGYSFYFPLILYLSAKLTFPVALLIALLAPGLLLLNYTRVLLGIRVGLVGGIVFLLLYQVFPTLGAFAGWNRGLVLLCLGMVTLCVVIDLQNRALKQAAAAVLLAMALSPAFAATQEVAVTLPGRLVDAEPEKELPALVSFDTAQYEMTVEESYVDVKVTAPVEVLRTAQEPLPAFSRPVHLLSRGLPSVLRWVTAADAFGLQAVETGEGVVQLSYRAPLTVTGKRVVAEVPLLRVPSGSISLLDYRPELDVRGGALWSTTKEGELTRYAIGVAGGEILTIEAAADPADVKRQLDDQSLARLYGIRVTESQQLTVINSDGTCTHFAEYQLPPFHPDTFELSLPEAAKIISVSVDGVEITEPQIEGGRCLIPVDGGRGGARRVSLRLALVPVRLGFIGFTDLALPDSGATVGTLAWTIVLPSGFHTRVVSSGLDALREPADLTGFGDYGRVLKSRDRISLGKTLVPPGVVNATLKYYQQVRGVTDDLIGAPLAERD